MRAIKSRQLLRSDMKRNYRRGGIVLAALSIAGWLREFQHAISSRRVCPTRLSSSENFCAKFAICVAVDPTQLLLVRMHRIFAHGFQFRVAVFRRCHQLRSPQDRRDRRRVCQHAFRVPKTFAQVRDLSPAPSAASQRRMIAMLTFTARLLFKTLDNMAIPCSVNA